MSEEQKFPSEVVDLPSEGKVYPKDHPLASGKVELKYMTAREEDILTSQNLIKKGLVIDKLLNALILTENVTLDDMVVGDKNAIMVAARILAYGPEYPCQIPNPDTGQLMEYTFNLAECPFKKIDTKITGNTFQTTLPVSKKKVKFKLITGKDEKSIEEEIESYKKLGAEVTHDITTRLKHSIVEVDGSSEKANINIFVDNMLSKDSIFLRKEIKEVSPDIEMIQKVEIGGEVVTVDIPMTLNFFWPKS
tara:strand:- start:608 stop:1354 length:747 start_codon:yes stop_codon:yes gene_type:complete